MDKNAKAVAVFNKLAATYQAKYMNVDSYADSFDLFCDNLAKNAAVLELACGPGNITRYLLNKRPDLQILATDFASNMIALAKANNPEAVFEIMDCREMRNLDKKFDAVMCGFCLPYLSKDEALALIHDASGIVLPGGILYLSTMEDDYSKSGLEAASSGDLVFMHYHQEDYLVEAILENGFQIIETQRKQYPDKNGIVTDLILIAQKHQK